MEQASFNIHLSDPGQEKTGVTDQETSAGSFEGFQTATIHHNEPPFDNPGLAPFMLHPSGWLNRAASTMSDLTDLEDEDEDEDDLTIKAEKSGDSRSTARELRARMHLKRPAPLTAEGSIRKRNKAVRAKKEITYAASSSKEVPSLESFGAKPYPNFQKWPTKLRRGLKAVVSS